MTHSLAFPVTSYSVFVYWSQISFRFLLLPHTGKVSLYVKTGTRTKLIALVCSSLSVPLSANFLYSFFHLMRLTVSVLMTLVFVYSH